ncbi:MAG: c-type cytochrome [Alphaproteobacteria bacterium]|nr:c-type cytochrome [Alphaproteobacteria bacterium]
MHNLEFNKIFAALLVAGIIAMLAGFVADVLTKPAHLKENAVKIEVAEVSAGGSGKPAGPDPILGLISTADIAKGEKLAKACAACHTFTKGGPNGVGPNLWNVVGGPKHHMAGFAYSGELTKHGGNTWSYEELNKFIWKPKAYAPGTKMNYIGLKKPDERAALIAWLREQADNSVGLPSEAAIAKEQAQLAPPAEDATEGAEAPAASAH